MICVDTSEKHKNNFFAGQKIISKIPSCTIIRKMLDCIKNKKNFIVSRRATVILLQQFFFVTLRHVFNI